MGRPGKSASKAGEVAEVYAYYRRFHPKAAPTLKSAAREYQLIRDRLAEGYTVESLRLAIDGNHLDEWCCGKNPEGREWHGLSLIFRDSSHVTKFVEVMGPSPTPGEGNAKL